MFARPTAFIVGAGAGWDYDMPVGERLKAMIVNKIKEEEEHFNHAVIRLGNHGNARDPAYEKAKQFIADKLFLAPSIDNFLHTYADDKAVVDVGKLAIAACILDAERNSKLCHQHNPSSNQTDLPSVQHTWLNAFCKMACEGVTKGQRYLIFQNVKIITFNYDRCIEHYVMQHVQAYFALTQEEAYELAASLEVVHVYGRIAPLEWESSNDPVAFGLRADYNVMGRASGNIRTFTERLQNDKVPQKIADILEEAELVIISGFSYGSANWEFLENNVPGGPKTVIAGVFDVSEPNQQYIKGKLIEQLHPGGEVTVHLCPKDFPSLLRNYSSMIA